MKTPVERYTSGRYLDVWHALDALVEAWEKLPAGRHGPMTVEQWLGNVMTPAINNAREVLGRKKPDGV